MTITQIQDDIIAEFCDIDDWMDYYNNDRYQMGLQKMSPNEFYTYISEGIYPVSMQLSKEHVKKFVPCP